MLSVGLILQITQSKNILYIYLLLIRRPSAPEPIKYHVLHSSLDLTVSEKVESKYRFV